MTAPAAGRERWAGVASLVVGGSLLLLTAGRVWATVVAAEPGQPAIPAALAGRDVVPALTGVGLLALAGGPAVLATRGVLRRVIGAVAAATGALAAWGAVAGRTPSARQVSDAVARAQGRPPAGTPAVELSAWWVVALLGALTVVAGGLLVLLRSGAWPGLGRRYERAPAGTTAPPPTSVPADGPGERTPGTEAGTRARTQDRPADLWAALDRGEDPTA